MAHALIIDDNAQNIAVLVRLLAQQGVNSTPVPSARQLVQAVEEGERLDIVFLDLEMPDQNGYEVLQDLQSDGRFNGIPVVAYTVHVSEFDVALELGFHSFLAKPLDPDRFPSQLRRILRGERVWERA